MISKNFLLSSLVHLALVAALFILLYQKKDTVVALPFELQLEAVHVHHFDANHSKNTGISAPKKTLEPSKDPVPAPETPAAATVNEAQTGGPNAKSTIASRYLSQLLLVISKQKFYPKASLLNEEAGVVFALVTLDSNGSLTHSEIKKSSGFPNLDAAALKTIQSIASFPTPPSELGTPLNIVVPINYEVNPDHN